MFFVLGIAFASLPVRSGSAQTDEAPTATNLDRNAIWRSIFTRPAQKLGEDDGASATEQARVALGAALFNDPRLSGTGTRACSSCHRPDRAFTDGQPRAVGLEGQPLPRNTPHLWNLAPAPRFFWDGRAQTLEAQAIGPLTDPREMAADLNKVVARLAADPNIVAAYGAAFPQESALSRDGLLSALAAYERTLISPLTRFDAWVAGDDGALSDQEKAGFDLFVGKGACVTCHGGWRFTDDALHDIGLPTADLGRGAELGPAHGIVAFKTPGLRELTHTAPYMHDGSLATLADVIAHYAGNLVRRPSLDTNIERTLDLDPAERAALEAFLRTLASESGASRSKPARGAKD